MRQYEDTSQVQDKILRKVWFLGVCGYANCMYYEHECTSILNIAGFNRSYAL